MRLLFQVVSLVFIWLAVAIASMVESGRPFSDSRPGLWSVVVFIVAAGIAIAAERALFISPENRWAEQKRRGRCVGCGYDLAGNVSGACPECGTKIYRP